MTASGPATVPAPLPGRAPGAATREAAPPPVVDVRDVFCLHRLPGSGAVAALRGLTLAVAAGERVVVHGPNGSGKTTLLGVLSGERRLSAGTAEVAGLDVSAASGRELAAWRSRHLGRVDQNPRRTLRPELDVLANVALHLRLAGRPRRAAQDAAREALERLGLAGLAARRPGTLSGGEAQRVAVCAALAHRPALVLADEPTGELDGEAAAQVYAVLGAAVADAGATLVLVSHDRRAAQVADRVVRIRDGRLSETWAPATSRESLVIDDRGWLRLPEPLRRRAGLGGEVVAEVSGDAVVLASPAPQRIEGAADPGPGPVLDAGGEAPDRRVVARLRGVTRSFGGRQVLGGVDLDVETGRLLAVAGPSGSGKSTLLRILAGLERPDGGEVALDGTDLAGCDRAALAGLRARLLAVVTQDVHLAGAADAAANLDLARAVRALPPDRDAVRRRLRELGLLGLGHRPVEVMSGGERQRVAVARALCVEPVLMILDEPSSQLDEASAEHLAAVLVATARDGTAVVVATHDPVLLAAADSVENLA